MTLAALSWHARVARRLLEVPLFHRGRVRPDDDEPSVQVARVSDQVMPSLTNLIHSLNVEDDSLTDEDKVWSADVGRTAELDGAVRRLRVTAVAVAFVHIFYLSVVAVIWTASGASVVEMNTSTINSTLCCFRQFPSRPTDECWVSSDVDSAKIRGLDSELDADNRLIETSRNFSAYFGCREILLSRYITPVNVKSNNRTVSPYCVDIYCNVTGNTSLSAGFTGLVYAGKMQWSSATTWIVSGLTTLAGIAVVGMVCLVSAASRFRGGRLRTAAAETRAALDRRRSATVDRCRCDRLLADMLPRGVAERLKLGQTIDPETFDVASVYFSDIVGFNDVALSCDSPLVIVCLLNRIFRYSCNITTTVVSATANLASRCRFCTDSYQNQQA